MTSHLEEHTEVISRWLRHQPVQAHELGAEMGYWLRYFGFTSIPDDPALLVSDGEMTWTAPEPLEPGEVLPGVQATTFGGTP